MGPSLDLHGHLAALEASDLLVRVTRPIDRDRELVPLVQLQFRGLPSERRRAFLFESVTDSRDRSFGAEVAIATFAASREGLGACRADPAGEGGNAPLELDTLGNGPRLLSKDLRSEASIHLDCLELETLAWCTHADLGNLLAPAYRRWRDPELDGEQDG